MGECSIAGCIELQRVQQVADPKGKESVPVGCCMVEYTMFGVYLTNRYLGNATVGTFDDATDVLLLRKKGSAAEKQKIRQFAIHNPEMLNMGVKNAACGDCNLRVRRWPSPRAAFEIPLQGI